MIELFLVKDGYMLEIPTESVTWSGQRYQAARKIDATIFYDRTGYHNPPQVIEGDTVLLKKNGNELFRGTVMDRSKNKGSLLSITAYDLLQYFLLNKEIYGSQLNGKRLDEVASRICKDFGIPHASFPNTKHKITTLLVDTETALYDILLRGMIQTHKGTKKRYSLYSRLGKVHLGEYSKADIQWVLEYGHNLTDYNYVTSIQETATKVKMISGEGKQAVTVAVVDEAGKKQFGTLQYVEKVSEVLNKAKLTERAKKTLAEKKGVKRTLDLEAVGIETITSSLMVYVKIPELRLTRSFYVDTDTHTFKGNSHTMSLKLIEEHEYPEMEEPTPAATLFGTGSLGAGTAATGKAAEVVNYAKSFIGKLSYHYGGKNIAGGSGDCSGFTKYVYAKAGVKLGDGTAAQVKQGQQIAADSAQAGDLVFFKGTIKERGPNGISHVGIVTRPGYCISLAGSGCKEHGYLKSTNSHWGGFFAHIRRVL